MKIILSQRYKHITTGEIVTITHLRCSLIYVNTLRDGIDEKEFMENYREAF